MLYEVITIGHRQTVIAATTNEEQKRRDRVDQSRAGAPLRKVVDNRRKQPKTHLLGSVPRDLGQPIDDLGIAESPENLVRITSYNVCYTKLLRTS